jgi:hypothetical protein
MPRAHLARHLESYGERLKEHTMNEFEHVNPDSLRAELAYRRERLTAGRRDVPTRLGRWYRSRRPTRPAVH